MTDYSLSGWRDAWLYPSRPALNTGSTATLRMASDGTRILVRPALPNLTGRTVLSATLRAHVRGAFDAQTLNLTRVTSGWAEGRVTSSSQPTVTTTGMVSVVTGALSDGDVIEFDVTAMVQLFADGTDYFGFRLTTSSATTQTLYSSESGEPAWEMDVTVSDAPDVPSNLKPDGGAASTSSPHVGWDFVDLGGESTDQAQSRVEVREGAATADPDLLAVTFDSGWVINADPTYDLAASAYVPGAGPSYFWRVNVQDGDGNESGFSDWAEYTVAAKPTVVMDSPTGTFGDPSPRVLAHLSTGTIETWDAIVTGPDRSDIRARTGRSTGAIDWQVPFRVDGRRVIREGKQGWLRVRIWDTTDRAAAIGDPAYSVLWTPLNLDEDALLAAPTGLSVAPLGDGDPRNRWTWSRTEAAEAWLLQVDGNTIVRLDADDVTASAGTYTWDDAGHLPPLRDITVGVRAVDAGKTSKAVTRSHSHHVVGVWIVPEDGADEPVCMAGGEHDDWVTEDTYATYTTLTGRTRHVFYGWKPRTGSFVGTLDARDPDVYAALERLENFGFNKNRYFRLVWGSQSEQVRLRDIDGTSSTEILPNNDEHVVRFKFDARGE